MANNNIITLNQQSIEQRVGVYLPPKMLANAQPWLVLEKLGPQKTPLPKNKGETIKWKRNVPFDVTTDTLVEGVTPAPQNFRQDIVSDTIDQYGAWSEITDKVADLHEDAIMDGIAEEMGKQVASTKELIGWQTIRGGTQVVYSGTATSRATVTAPVAVNQVRAAVAVLKGNHGNMITSKISAGAGYGTTAVGESYVIAGHTDQQYDWEDVDGFRPVEEYASNSKLCAYEIGKVKDARIVLTPHFAPFYGAGSATITGNLTRDGAANDVYASVVMAKEFWGTTELSGMGSVGVTVEQPKPTKDDPLGQRGFASWKFYYCATRLNESWGVRIEATASDWS